MQAWWCAIDRRWTSYDEFKGRSVVAQGWPALGDLSHLLHHAPNAPDDFKAALQALGDQSYANYELWITKDRQLHRAPSVLWNLLSLQAGDLVVGIEGATVRGVCELDAAGYESYRFAPEIHYGQTVGPVRWVDWDPGRFDLDLTAPAQSVHGIKRLRGQAADLAAAWQRLDNAASRP